MTPLDAEGGRCKLGASGAVTPQAGPLRFLAGAALSTNLSLTRELPVAGAGMSSLSGAMLSVVGGMLGREP